MTTRPGATPDENNRPLPWALPCPFCGGTKIATYEGSTFRWRYAACNGCGAQAGEVRIETISLPRPEAIAQADKELLAEWNTRTSPSSAAQKACEDCDAPTPISDRAEAERPGE